jgi:hypothetical protein
MKLISSTIIFSLFAILKESQLTSLTPTQTSFYHDPRVQIPRNTLELVNKMSNMNSRPGIKGKSWADVCKSPREQTLQRLDEMSPSNADQQLTWRNRTKETVLFSNRTMAARAVLFARRVIAGDFGLAEMNEVLERCRCRPP